jgi:hypothetical protein
MWIALLKAVITFLVVRMLLVFVGVAAGADIGVRELWIVNGVALVTAVVVYRRSRRPASAGA